MKRALAAIICITLLWSPATAYADVSDQAAASSANLPGDVVPITNDTSGSTASEQNTSGTAPTGTDTSDTGPSDPADPASSGQTADKQAKALKSDAKLGSGYYYLYPAISKTRVVTIRGGSGRNGANAYLFKYLGEDKQIFHIKALGDGTYRIRNKKSGLVLEAADGGTANKTNIRQGTDNKRYYQRWYIFKNGSNYVFQNAASQKVMYVSGGKDQARANICLYKYTGARSETFSLKKVHSSSKYKISTRKWDDSRDYEILTNIVGAVESGGQVYGNRDYSAYEGPYSNSSNEHTITVGWAQYYGEEAQNLIRSIYNANKKKFKKIDSKGLIQKALKKNWVATHWNPSSAEKKVILKLIKSSAGKKCQDALFKELMKTFVEDCKRLYTNNAWAIHMYCQIRHLGGANGAKRIFDRCKGNYTLESIMAQLKRDQYDGRSSYQVGDSVFWSRHVKCCEFLQKYAV